MYSSTFFLNAVEDHVNGLLVYLTSQHFFNFSNLSSPCQSLPIVNISMLYFFISDSFWFQSFSGITSSTYFIETVLNKDDKYNFEQFTTRLVFSKNELVEKLAIFEIGLNDKVIEFIKYGFFDHGLIDLSKYDSVYFDGIKETKLEFILFNSNRDVEIDKIFIDIQFYNNLVEKINKIKDDIFVFPSIDRNWVLSKISNEDNK